jgi:hypothetical protein
MHYQTMAIITLNACSTAFSTSKRASKQFQKFLENFTDGEDY